MKTLNILVVEDNELQHRAALVQLAGHNVVVAPDFVTFQKEFRKGGWDIVLTDLNFPVNADYGIPNTCDSNGIPWTQPQPIGAIVILMAQNAKVPVKVLSSHGDAVNYPLERMGLVVYGRHDLHVDNDTLLEPSWEEVIQSLDSSPDAEDRKHAELLRRVRGKPTWSDYTCYWKSDNKVVVKNWKKGVADLVSLLNMIPL